MGKKSLIKSTTKKKSETTTEKAKPAQKTAAKSTKKTPAKTTKKAPAKTKPKPAAKAPAAKTKAAAKKLTVKELTFLKFDSLKPDLKKISPAKPKAAKPTAPPFITTKDPEEVARLKTLLAKRFSMDEIKAAAKAPAAEPVATPAVASQKTEPKQKPKIEKAQEAVAAAAKPKPQPEEKPYITVEPEKPAATPADPVTRSVKIAAAAAVLLVLILLAVSANNSSKYYLKPIASGLEIWKGDFSPKDRSIFMVLPGVNITGPMQDVYSKKEVFPLIFNYYLDKADALPEVSGLPDYEGIKRYLHQAEAYAVTNEMANTVNERLNTIERMALLYKADVDISRNTEDSLESAIQTLKKADKLTANETQSAEIAQKITAAREALEALRAKPASATDNGITEK